MAYMAFAAKLLPPLVCTIMSSLAERRGIEALPEDSTARTNYRAPRISRLAATGGAAVIVAAMFALNLATLPILPNEYDAIGRYRVPTGTNDSECRNGQVTQNSCDGGYPKIVPPDPTIPTYEPPDFSILDPSVFDLPTVVVPTP